MAAIAAAKKNAKGNKTAHVLNLLTAPGEAAPAPAESEADTPVQETAAQSAASSRPLLPPILEVAQANDDNLAQQIQQALEEELSQTAPAGEPAPFEELVPEAVKAPAPAPQPAPAPASGGKMSQDEIEKMLAAMSAPAEAPTPAPAPAPAPQPAPAPASGGKMSQDEIEKMLAAMSAPAETPAPTPAPAPAPQPAPAPASGGKMSQDEIERMLAAMSAPAETPAPTPAPAPAPQPAPAPASGGKMSQDEIEKMLTAMSAPAETPAPAPAPAPQPAPKQPAPPPEEEISYVNVMQTLVEEIAPRYIKKFGLCTCKQCEADVKALTLTNLVPKYVVLSKQDRIPMLTVYEGRFNTTIFAQLTRACKTVMDHPHHKREK